MDLNSDSKKKKDPQFSFHIPQIQKETKFKSKLEFEIKKRSQNTQKIDIEIKREPKKSTEEYLEILKKLNILLNSHSITDIQRRDFCKSQRYFMKLYLDQINND